MKILSFENQKQAFPLHYHPEYCISLIKKGVELISIGEEQFMGNVNDITITHPYELHANPLHSTSSLLSFDTLYVSEKEARSILPFGKIPFFKQRVINDEALQKSFEEITDKGLGGFDDSLQEELVRFITLLSGFGELDEHSRIEKPMSSWEAIDEYVEQNIKDTISLQDMAQVANLNKFSFARKFKRSTGMSPVHYTLMKKVFHCKETITRNCSLTQKAYEYNFTDASHFSKAFKKFIGIRPKVYQENFLS